MAAHGPSTPPVRPSDGALDASPTPAEAQDHPASARASFVPRNPHGRQLPDFPWDQLTPFKATAAEHPDGVVDLSVGTPVDPVPAALRQALADAANSPGYPQTHGTPALRTAIAQWLQDSVDVDLPDPAAVLPTMGSKELVAWLPTLLGLGGAAGPTAGGQDQIGHPHLAYPTYAVGARLAGAEPVSYTVPGAIAAADPDPTDLDPSRLRMLWLNSPANPTGQVLGIPELRRIVAWGREHGVLIASDECYIELGWDASPVSVLHRDVCGGSPTGLLAVHSLSKRSNFAGYRGAFVAGDPDVVRHLLAVRKHAGMMVPAPVQAAMVAALADREHVAVQRERYIRRRAVLRQAFTGAGFRIEHSAAGLYLWATRDQPCWETVAELAKLGIVVTPGDFYGPAGARFVRIALTATDDQVAAVAQRLA